MDKIADQSWMVSRLFATFHLKSYDDIETQKTAPIHGRKFFYDKIFREVVDYMYKMAHQAGMSISISIIRVVQARKWSFEKGIKSCEIPF